jgi:poly(3-hydroxybutyrate) depolymerase
MHTQSSRLLGGCLIMVGAITLACSGSTTLDGGSSSAGGTMTDSGGSSGSGGTSVGTSSGGAGGAIVGTGGKGTGGASESTGGTSDRGGAPGGRTGAPGGRTGAPGGRTGAPGGRTGALGGRTGTGDGTGGANTGGQAAGGSTGGGGDAVKSDGCGKTPSLKSGSGLSITVSGSSRTYNLKVPDPYDNSKPYRLIMSYHWLGGTANDVSNGGVAKPYYGLWDLAGGSTIFVAPQGLSNAWNNSSGADVEFSRQLITLIESEFCIDKSRIFCEGFSMGGSMSYAMACGMGDVIRGVAVHSGGTMSGCAKHDKPVAYFMTHGTKDSVCTYPSFALPPLMDFAKVDGCTDPDPSLSQSAFEALLPEPTSTAGACIDFKGCKEGYPVRSCLFVGDHTPSPDGTNGWVPKESWKFISQF